MSAALRPKILFAGVVVILGIVGFGLGVVAPSATSGDARDVTLERDIIGELRETLLVGDVDEVLEAASAEAGFPVVVPNDLPGGLAVVRVVLRAPNPAAPDVYRRVDLLLGAGAGEQLVLVEQSAEAVPVNHPGPPDGDRERVEGAPEGAGVERLTFADDRPPIYVVTTADGRSLVLYQQEQGAVVTAAEMTELALGFAAAAVDAGR